MHQDNSSRKAIRPQFTDRGARLAAAAAATTLGIICAASPAIADQIAYWDFNAASTAPTSFNSNLGAVPSLSVIGGVTSNFATGSGSGDPTQPGQGFNTLSYPSQGTGNKTGGVQFNFNTSNFDVSSFSFDWR